MTYLDPTFRGPGLTIRIALLLLALVAGLALVYVISPTYISIYWATVLLPIPAVLLFLLAIRFWQQGPDRYSPPLFIAGSLFIIGGLLFDLGATVHHSPDLAREGNPLARCLLDSGMPLEFVYYYAFAMQLNLALVLCTLWGAFLRHRWVWLKTSQQLAPHSFLDFLKATTGGGLLSWREYLLSPLPPDAKPSVYHMGVFLLPPGLIAAGLHRWYVGLEWFGVVPYVSPGLSGCIALLIGFILSVVGLYVWFRRNAQPMVTTEAPA